MPYEDFVKVIDHFDRISFCGQLSDPVHHPEFVKFLQHCNDMKKSTYVSHASASKPLKWYPKAFDAYPGARWVFGLDGLPKNSHTYRLNQDGEKMFEIMKLAKKHLSLPPVWQYIVFSYNEENIDEARALAVKLEIELMIKHSSRWRGEDDFLKPSKKYSLEKFYK